MCSDTSRARLASVAPGAVVLAAALLFAACSSGPSARPAAAKQAVHVEVKRDDTGFDITEAVRVSGEARSDYENALRLIEQKQYEPAIALLSKLTQSTPNVTAFHIDLGIAYSRSGDLDHAQASLQRALELNPKQPVAYNELGMVQRRKGQFTDARASYEKALALYPEFHFARRNLGILCDVYLADLDCALAQYEAYRQAVPDDPDVTKWIADVRNRVKH